MATETRRDRKRAATVDEIARTARRILVEQGADAVTLRAIARDMGMTAPGLYRYFDGRAALIDHVVGELFDELVAVLGAALHTDPPPTISGKFLTSARAFRRWCLEHPREFALMFGSLPEPMPCETPEVSDEAGNRFGRAFLDLFDELWAQNPFAIRADDAIDPSLRAQLERYRDELDRPDLPLGLLLTFLEAWARLEGMVNLEIFGHLCFALDDAEPLFELMLVDLARVLGLTYAPPATGP